MSKTIIAVAVHPKLNPGDGFWLNDNAWGITQQVVLLSRPYWKAWETEIHADKGTWWIDLQFPEGDVRTRSLGDLGVTGFSYDDRPCTLATTEEASDIAATQYWLWWENTRDEAGAFGDTYY